MVYVCVLISGVALTFAFDRREKYLMPAITIGTGDMFLKFCSAYSRKIYRQVFYLSDIRIKILIYLSRHTAHSFIIRITQYAGKVNMIVIF